MTKLSCYLILFLGGMAVQWGWSTYFPFLGISPQLLMMLVIAVAAESGPVLALNFGFLWGLFLDLLGVHLFGANALALTALAYVVGTLRRQMDVSSPLSQIMVVAIATIAYFLFLAVTGLVFEKHFFWAGWDVFLLSPLLNCLICPIVFSAARGLVYSKN